MTDRNPDRLEPGDRHDLDRHTVRPARPCTSPTPGRRRPASRRAAESCRPIMELSDVSVFYGDYEAVRGTTLPIAREPDHGDDRPVRLRQVHRSCAR